MSAALDSLRTALIAGDLAALPGLAETLERLCPDAASGLALAELEALRARARTAGVMLEATARGLRAARRRVDEVAQAGRGLATYDRSGQRRQIGAAMASLPRRI
ncbi:MAG TPA: hypothetical protein PKC84_15095 [Paracoccaceae bacterium]|nr:hypothetical protein [Paracoccaceae bacterium]